MSRKKAVLSLILGLTLVLASAALLTAGETRGKDAFERIAALEGTWVGEAQEGHPAHRSEFRLSANGTVMMETMMPGTDHEMINMYHLDGEDLVLTHYCAGGNQPVMRLDREAATAEKLPFAFVGGTNLDPEVDDHIHSLMLDLSDSETVVAHWTGYSGGEEAHVMKMSMTREK